MLIPTVRAVKDRSKGWIIVGVPLRVFEIFISDCVVIKSFPHKKTWRELFHTFLMTHSADPQAKSMLVRCCAVRSDKKGIVAWDFKQVWYVPIFDKVIPGFSI